MKLRYWGILFGVFVVAVFGLVLTGRPVHHDVLGDESEIVLATPPLVTSVTADDLGVTITWQMAQQGSYPINSYQILKKDASGQFGQIGEVSANIAQYIDQNGKKGDAYKLTSSDDQQP